MLEVAFFLISLAVLGALFGSFINVVVDRSFHDESFLKGRSHCDSCKQPLKVLDLIPIFSYVVLGGKCRYCKSIIPAGNLSVEIVSSLTFFFFGIFLVGRFPNNYLFINLFTIQNFLFLLFWISLLVSLLIIFVSDFKYMVISTSHFLALMIIYVFGFVINYFFPGQYLLSFFYENWISHIYGLLAMFIFFGSLSYFSKERLMGEGDIYLSAIFGLYLGLEKTIIMWFLSFFIGSIFGIALLLSRKKKMASAIPFGPFLIIGFILSAFFSAEIETFYYGLILLALQSSVTAL